MLRRIIVALIGLLAVVNGSKWLFDGKRLPILGLDVKVFAFFTPLLFLVLDFVTKPREELKITARSLTPATKQFFFQS